MLDSAGVIIYIGKAKNLKNRVRSYFVSVQNKDIKTQVLVSQIADIKLIITASESAALVLEKKLIKHHQPRYNIDLKDDKSYPYIKVTFQDDFPRVVVTRIKKKDGAKYFGPYANIGSSKAMERTLNNLFPIRDCSKPITLDKIQRKCINLDIGKCLGPCIYKEVKGQYDAVLEDLVKLLKGKDREVVQNLTLKMKQYSDELKFEKAGEIKLRIEQINQLMRYRKVDQMDYQNVQIWGYVENETHHYILNQNIINGVLISQNGAAIEKDRLSQEVFVQQRVLQQFERQCWIPEEIICDETIYAAFSPINDAIKQSIKFTIPEIGNKKSILQAALRSAKVALLNATSAVQLPNSNELLPLAELKSVLGLKNLPSHIMGFDISHLSGQRIVASCVDFKDGKPDKSMYRKFDIRTVQGNSNDPLSMYEAVKRRLTRAEADGDLPDLILIDGGRGQLNFAYKALTELGLSHKIDMISLAKREEEVYKKDEEPLQIGPGRGRFLLQYIRDESHRFAVTFQRSKRSKDVKNSILLEIPGLGPKRLNKLYKTYGDLFAVDKKNAEDVAKDLSIGIQLANQIKEKIRKALS